MFILDWSYASHSEPLNVLCRQQLKKKKITKILFEDWKAPQDMWSWDFRLFPLLQKPTAAASRKHLTSYTAMVGKGNPILPSSFNTSQTEYIQTEQQLPMSTGAHEKMKRPPVCPLGAQHIILKRAPHLHKNEDNCNSCYTTTRYSNTSKHTRTYLPNYLKKEFYFQAA